MSETTEDQAHDHTHLDETQMHDAARQIMELLQQLIPCPTQRVLMLNMIQLGIIAGISSSDREFREMVDDVAHMIRGLAKGGRDLSSTKSQLILPKRLTH